MQCYFVMVISIWYFVIVLFPETSFSSNLCPCHYSNQIQVNSKNAIKSAAPINTNFAERALVCCNVSSLKQIGSCDVKRNSFDAENDGHNSVVTTQLIIERSPKLEGNFSLELFLKTFNIAPEVSYVFYRNNYIWFLYQYNLMFIKCQCIFLFICRH